MALGCPRLISSVSQGAKGLKQGGGGAPSLVSGWWASCGPGGPICGGLVSTWHCWPTGLDLAWTLSLFWRCD